MMVGRRVLLRAAALAPFAKRRRPVGWESNNVFQVLIITGSGQSGVFVYSPKPGAGNLVASITASSGTDNFGNATLAGVTAYSSTLAVQQFGGASQYYTAPSEAGPWTLQGGLTSLAPGTGMALSSQAAGSAVEVTAHGVEVASFAQTQISFLSTGGSETWLVPSGDTTGAADTAAINAAMPGPIHLLPGTFTANISPKTFTRLLGSGKNITTLKNTPGQPLFSCDTANGKLDSLEISNMTIDCTGGDIFFGANMVRADIHHCWLIQRSAGNAIFNCSAATGLGQTYLAECDFHHNREYVFGTPRTIEAWHLDMEGVNAANDNHWRLSTLFNQDHDTAKYYHRIIGNAGATPGSKGNTFEDLTYEFPTGGMIRLEGVSDCCILQCTNEDLAALTTTTTPLISIGTTAGGAPSQFVRVANYMRRAGSFASIVDIGADSSAEQQIDLENCTQDGGGTPLTINLNGAILQSARGIGAQAGGLGGGSTGGISTRTLQAEGLSGTLQAPVNGSTITIDNPVVRVNPAAAVTGIILTPGVQGGQMVTVINQSVANSVTFAASGTSNVADGVADVIAAVTAKRFVWNSAQSLWYSS